MANNEEEEQTFFHLPTNINNIPRRFVPQQRIQQQVGQVVRGVIPGAGPQPEYHPNPYLQHIYSRHASSEDHGEQEDAGPILDLDQLQEIVVDNNSEHGHGHTHGHTHMPDLQNRPLDWKVFMGSFAFSIILLLRLMADHILGILVFLGLSIAFYYSNNKMIEIVHITSLRERQHSKEVLCSCLVLMGVLLMQMAGIYWFFDDQQLWRVLCYDLPTSWQGDLFDLFWVTMVTDHIIRFGTIALKCLVSITPHLCLAQKKKGKLYMFIETLSQAYRTGLPIVPWLHFLYDQPKSGKLIFAAILVTIYVILKVWCLFMEMMKIKKAFITLRTDKKFGVAPTVEELKSRDEHCPICQDDYQDPVVLTCKHIFCENCVSIWFDREKTCPMCRAQIQTDSPVWQDGSTSAHLQWY